MPARRVIKWSLITLAVMVALCSIYGTLYAWMLVGREMDTPCLDGEVMHVDAVPCYKQTWIKPIMAPANKVDRLVRPHLWSFREGDSAEHVLASDVIGLRYPSFDMAWTDSIHSGNAFIEVKHDRIETIVDFSPLDFTSSIHSGASIPPRP